MIYLGPNNPNGQTTKANSTPVVIASDYTPPLAALAAQDGVDITAPTAMPAGGSGIRGWLSSIYTKLSGSLAVTGTFFQATQPVSIATAPATAKNIQGANALPTQDLKDAGRNQIHFYTVIPVLTSATDTLQVLTATKSGVTVAATATPAVVTAAKTLRVTRMAATYIATAVSGYGIIRLRFNTAGVVAITSPVAATLAVGSSAPVTANATDTEEASIDEGWEFAAGTGIGISTQGFSGVTGTAVGYLIVSCTGYEY